MCVTDTMQQLDEKKGKGENKIQKTEKVNSLENKLKTQTPSPLDDHSSELINFSVAEVHA